RRPGRGCRRSPRRSRRTCRRRRRSRRADGARPSSPPGTPGRKRARRSRRTRRSRASLPWCLFLGLDLTAGVGRLGLVTVGVVLAQVATPLVVLLEGAVLAVPFPAVAVGV